MSWMQTYWFQAIKAALSGAVATILVAQANGAALPEWLAPILAVLNGLLQVGQRPTK